MIGRFDHRANFALSSQCRGLYWREAIALLADRSARLRLEAARDDLSQVNGTFHGYSLEDSYARRMERAALLDELAHWLRDRMDLPKDDAVLRAKLALQREKLPNPLYAKATHEFQELTGAHADAGHDWRDLPEAP